jgi:methylthioribose-1-phosphate isomerase
MEYHFEMIDQRLLPEKFEYISYYSARSVADGIRSMVVRGAPAIGCAAAYGVALAAIERRNSNANTFQQGMNIAFDVLAKSRPTAVNLFWALQRMQAKNNKNSHLSSQKIANILLQEAHDIRAEDIQINRQIGANGAELLADGARVLTHCNTGALATAGHGTALGVFRSAVEAGKSPLSPMKHVRFYRAGRTFDYLGYGAGKHSRYLDL